MINDIANDFSPLITSSLTKFVRCAIYHRKMDAVRHFIFKILPSAIPEFVAYLIKDTMHLVVKSCVRHRSAYSLFFHSYIGLKQGDPSSPILFMLFINDIVQNIKSDSNDIFTVDDMQLFLLLYCDDAVVFANSLEVLQSMLYDIETYCTQWGLKINTKKTKAMIFEKRET